MGKFKKFVFPSATLLFSFWFSAIFALGVFIGYFSTYIFDLKITKKEKINSVILNFGKWKFHFHHWLMGAIVILGFAGGVMAHDLHLDQNWHKIIMKKE